MRNNTILLILVSALAAFYLISCAQQPKTANSKEAIQQAKTMENVKAQVDFLVSEANGFVNSQKFDDAINTAKYVLTNLDKESQDAKSIIEKAQAKLKAMAEEKAQQMKEDLQKKMGTFGK